MTYTKLTLNIDLIVISELDSTFADSKKYSENYCKKCCNIFIFSIANDIAILFYGRLME